MPRDGPRGAWLPPARAPHHPTTAASDCCWRVRPWLAGPDCSTASFFHKLLLASLTANPPAARATHRQPPTSQPDHQPQPDSQPSKEGPGCSHTGRGIGPRCFFFSSRGWACYAAPLVLPLGLRVRCAARPLLPPLLLRCCFVDRLCAILRSYFHYLSSAGALLLGPLVHTFAVTIFFFTHFPRHCGLTLRF